MGFKIKNVCMIIVVKELYVIKKFYQEYVDEAKKMTIEEISKHIYGIKMSSLEEYIYSKKRDKNNKQDVRCYLI